MSGGSTLAVAAAAGALLGAAYTMSPLTVLALAALWPIWLWARRGCSPRERQWLAAVLILAVAARVLVVAALFLTADNARPFATFFGDEEFYLSRTVWLRNLAHGLPIAASDVIYLFDDVGQTSHVYALAYLQTLVGEAPYGVHLLNTTFYIAGAIGLYRLVRPAFGGIVAMGGLVVLLFLPSLFAWSLSALKESSYLLVAMVELILAVLIVRAPTWWQRVLAVAGVLICALALDSLRVGGLVFALLGSAAGIAAAFVVPRPRLLLATAIFLPVATALALTQAPVRGQVLSVLRHGASYHSGHVATPGVTYQLIEPRYYWNRDLIASMPADEAARFAVRAVISYFTVPLPWKIETPLMLAYLPEQMIWYLLVAFAAIGVFAGLKLDPLLTSLIAAHAAAAIMIVALTSGNVGTLVRHRSLALPYLVWLSALGVYQMLRRVTETHERHKPREQAR